ncbi:MAG: DNA polymerase IV [Victivallales bacterium]|jgi:DNA polymerase-4|nr:DNA polymerase IV [Victivallales bacterium]
MRKIIHIDMDAFFASIEQRDRPELRGCPVIVGGAAERRGVVSTCSYEARAFGVHSAMPTRSAKRLCPQAVFLDVDMKKYQRESAKIRDIFHRFSALIEPVSIDEAYLDVTENFLNEPSATKIARAILREIYLATGLTASAGVSYNKFLAKIASDSHKPAGLTVITPEQALAFIDTLPVGKFHGIGRVSAAKLIGMNVKTGRDLRQLDAGTLGTLFGKTGLFYYNIVRGIDNRPVEGESEPKSVGHEITMVEDCSDIREKRIILRQLARRVSHRLQSKNLMGKTVTIKVRYANFETVTRSLSLPQLICDGSEIGEIAIELAAKTELATRPVRLLGVTVGNFATPETEPKFEQLMLPF